MRHIHPPTSARVDISVPNNASFNEAFQFDDPTVLSWNFTGKTFRMGVKGNYEDDVALITFVSGPQIVVDDTVARVLHFNVDDVTLRAALIPGCYVYDLVMTDASNVKTQLMHGSFNFAQGVTGD